MYISIKLSLITHEYNFNINLIRNPTLIRHSLIDFGSYTIIKVKLVEEVRVKLQNLY